MKKFFLSVLLLLVVAGTATASDYRYLSQGEFKKWLETGKRSIVVDIQVADQFEKHHFRSAVETNAFPVKTEEQKKRLDPVLETIKKSGEEVVIICPRGGGGAKNAYDYLKAKGVAENRLLILEKGMEGWPFPELTRKGRL